MWGLFWWKSKFNLEPTPLKPAMVILAVQVIIQGGRRANNHSSDIIDLPPKNYYEAHTHFGKITPFVSPFFKLKWVNQCFPSIYWNTVMPTCMKLAFSRKPEVLSVTDWVFIQMYLCFSFFLLFFFFFFLFNYVSYPVLFGSPATF